MSRHSPIRLALALPALLYTAAVGAQSPVLSDPPGSGGAQQAQAARAAGARDTATAVASATDSLKGSYTPATPRPGNPPPAYPPSLRQFGVSGEVLATIVVDTTGRPVPGSLDILSASDKRLTTYVRAVLPRWHFEPAVRDGRKVQERLVIPFVFRKPG
ncbi:MAG: energy transducer TonB [Gemmatimonadaceae bacterium]